MAAPQQRKVNQLPRLNSAALSGNGNVPQQVENQTPGTAGMDMNFTPLLPSNLLINSPYQQGSPQFQSPQFANFAGFNQNQGMFTGNQMAQAGMRNPMSSTSPGAYNMSNISPIQGMPGAFFGQGYPSLQSPTGMGGFNMAGMADVLQSPVEGRGNFSLGSPTSMNMPGAMQHQSTSRTVYLGNIPSDTSAEEILSHVRSGQIESVRLLTDKNCAFISFLDGSSATHFHSDAILKKLAINGADIKVGWGKPSSVPTSVALAVQNGASRNVYLGNLPEDITEEEIREDLSKFGPIDTIKIVREKNIAFVHYLSIGNAIKCNASLPQEPKWQAPRRVHYGKDRCAYVSKTQQQNAAQYLGIPAGYASVLNGADREIISNALAQQSVAAAAVATSAGGVSNLGNRTVYLGNIHPETTIEEICNVVRGGLLHHIRYIPDKHICFVTFIDPTAAASFYALSNLQGLMIHNRRLKIGWGKHSGALPPAIAMAVSGGASRNVYVGNLDDSWTEERLRQDFSEYGEIELVNTLREKSCAFVNFLNIANAIKAIEGMRGKEEYKRFKINFGKDRCGNPPRQNTSMQGQQNGQGQQMGLQGQQLPDMHHQSMSQSPGDSNNSPVRSNSISPGPNAQLGGLVQPQPLGPAATAVLNGGNANPLTMYLSHVQNGTIQTDSPVNGESAGRTYTIPTLSPLQEGQVSQSGLSSNTNDLLSGSLAEPQSASTSQPPHNGLSTIGGHVTREKGEKGSSHSRTVSLPVFTHDPFSQGQERQSAVGSALPPPSHRREQSSFTGLGSTWGGFGGGGFGLGLGKVEEASR